MEARQVSSLLRKIAITGAVLVVFVGVIVVVAEIVFWDIAEEKYEKLRGIEIGMSERDVIKKLGSPTMTYTKDSAPKDYYVEGYSKKKREITNKVLIYVLGEPIGYYYIDNDGKVEDRHVGGS